MKKNYDVIITILGTKNYIRILLMLTKTHLKAPISYLHWKNIWKLNNDDILYKLTKFKSLTILQNKVFYI